MLIRGTIRDKLALLGAVVLLATAESPQQACCAALLALTAFIVLELQ